MDHPRLGAGAANCDTRSGSTQGRGGRLPKTQAVRERLETARAFLRAGEPARAEPLLREVLARDPRHPEALHALARIALESGRDAEAVPLLEAAIARVPDAATLHADLAVALQNLGLNPRAESAARRALALEPRQLSALNTLGNALRALGRAEEALGPLREAARLGPDVALVHLNLASALLQAGRPDEALAACERAAALGERSPEIQRRAGALLRSLQRPSDAGRALLRALELDPGDADAHNALGNLFVDAGEPEAAEASYRRALAARPESVEALYNLGTLLAARGRHDEAIPALQSAARLAPDFTDAHVRLGQACCDLGRFEEAGAHFRRALELDSAQADAHNGLGNALRAQGRGTAAAAEYARAIELRPEFAEAHCNLATVALDEGAPERAVTHARRALAIRPDLADARWNLAQAHLTLGRLTEGWREYEWRQWRTGAAELAYPWPLWDGEPFAGGTLFVTAEQGVGDEIMFASCLPEAIAAADRVVVECDARLTALFERSFPPATFVARLASADAYPERLPAPSVRIASGSLPGLFRPDLASFPGRDACLVVDPERVAIWGARFASLGPGLRVGISWRGGKEALVRRARSIALPRWRALARGLEVQWINLQYGDCAAELAEARAAGLEVHHWDDADPLRDLDGFAAQIAALDLVISVDNSTVHMAGALGQPAWVLLPSTADWRWMLEREDSPWYPSLRLFRQRRPGEWDEVFARVRAALEQRLAEPPSLRPGSRPAPRVGAAPGEERRTARPPRREWVALVNDTSHWYHWGCTATSGALTAELERRGYAIERVPISGLQACAAAPGTLEQFDDPRVFRRFVAANAWLWRALDGVDRVVINGEGSLHGLSGHVVNLLYVAYAARRHLGKGVQIVNHSCYPDESDGSSESPAWALYARVYSALDHVVIREPVSHERMTRAGLTATLGGDCLPLAAAKHRAARGRLEREGVVLAGSVALREADLPAYAALGESLLARRVPVTILTGADLFPALEEEAFASTLAARLPGSRRLEATSLPEWFDALAGAAAVVSGRFHHTLAAASFGTPFVLLGSNSPKNAGLAAMLDAAHPVPLDAPDLAGTLVRETAAALEAPGGDDAAAERRLAALCELALRNFDRLPPVGPHQPSSMLALTARGG
jgi:tetratricopeptide (TPR) repeat protein/polysaccharide pyruvyl transferase WcaK-like protein